MNEQATLHVHLQEGFENEHVVIYVDNRIVLDEPTIRTKTQTGLARMVEFDTLTDPVMLRVEFRTRGHSRALQVDATRTPYVGVSVDGDGGVLLKPQAEPFGYL